MFFFHDHVFFSFWWINTISSPCGGWEALLRTIIHPATLLLWPHRDVFLARDGFSQSLSTLHLQPAGEEQDYSSLCNRGDQLLDLNAKDLRLSLAQNSSLGSFYVTSYASPMCQQVNVIVLNFILVFAFFSTLWRQRILRLHELNNK